MLAIASRCADERRGLGQGIKGRIRKGVEDAQRT
jgi:hypothetical protein